MSTALIKGVACAAWWESGELTCHRPQCSCIFLLWKCCWVCVLRGKWFLCLHRTSSLLLAPHHVAEENWWHCVFSFSFFSSFFSLSLLHLPKPCLTSGDDVIPPEAPPLPPQRFLLSVGCLLLQAAQHILWSRKWVQCLRRSVFHHTHVPLDLFHFGDFRS